MHYLQLYLGVKKMDVYIQDFMAEILELVTKLLSGIPIIVEVLLDSFTLSAFYDIIYIVEAAAEPLIYAIYGLVMNIGHVLVNSGYDSVNGTNVTPGDPGTPLGGITSLLDSVPLNIPSAIIGDGSGGITYMIQALTYVLENDSSYNFVGSRFTYALYNLLSWVIELIASLMQNLQSIFP